MLVETLRNGIPLHWQELREVEIVLEDLAERDGEDLLHPGARAIFSQARGRLEELNRSMMRAHCAPAPRCRTQDHPTLSSATVYDYTSALSLEAKEAPSRSVGESQTLTRIAATTLKRWKPVPGQVWTETFNRSKLVVASTGERAYFKALKQGTDASALVQLVESPYVV